MKKNFVKKLAVALSLAMTVSTLAPAASADAAAAPAFKSYKTSVYENGTNGGSYTYTVKNVKKNYTVKWSVTGAGKDYVKVSKSSTKATGTTVSNTVKVATNGETAAKNAKATVTAKVYDTKSKLVKTVSDAVTVKVQATNVVIYAADGGNFVTAVGEKYDLNRTLTPANSTSKTYWTVDSEDATIDTQGVLTATKAGEYTVTATVRNAKTSKDLTTATQKVTVKESVLKSVSQTTSTELAAVFAGDTSKVKNTDITITRTTDNVVFPVSKVTVDSTDKTKVTLTTFSKMADGKEYTVKYGDTTLNFVATDGKATSLVVDPVTIPFNEPTTINVLGKDAKGVTVFSSPISGSDMESKLEVVPETTQGYVSDGKLVLFEKGNTAKITATLHTYEYNTDGTEKDVIKTEATITAVDPEAVSLTDNKYTISTADKADWTKAANTKIAVGETGNLFYELKNSKGEVVTDKYTDVKSSDTDTLLVTASPNTTGKVQLVPVKEGTAYVLVSDKDGNVVASFAVTVVAKREMTTVVLEPASVTVSGAIEDTATVKVTARDQYGDKMPVASLAGIIKKSGSDEANTLKASDLSYDATKGTITVNTTSSTVAGTYVFEVQVGTLKRMLTVTVQARPDDGIDTIYKVTLSTNKVDTTVTTDFDPASTKIGVQVAGYKNNVKVEKVVSGASIKVLNEKGETVQIVTGGSINVTSEAVSEAGTTTVTNKLGAGSYTVKVEFTSTAGKLIVITTGFVVTDSQPAVTAIVKKDSYTGSIQNAVKDSSVVDYYYNGVKIENPSVTYKTNSAVVSGKQYAAAKVTVNVEIGQYILPAEVTLSRTITVTE